MKTSFFITLTILIACSGGRNNATQKYFTGTIEYSYTYSSDSLNADSLTAARPATSDFRYDANDYQSRFVGKDTGTYYYSGIRNKCLGKISSEENYSCEDYSAVTDSVISWKIFDTEGKILGQACRILEMQKRNSRVKYYVSREMKLAPATYQKHKSYNWDFYGEKADGGLILKSEHRFRHFTMKGIATVVNISNDRSFKALEITEELFNEKCKDK